MSTRSLLTVLIPAALVGGLVAAPSSRADDDDDADAAEAEARAQLKQARKEARQQLKEAREQIANAPMPDKLREQLLAKLERIAEAVDARLQEALSADLSNLDDLDEQMQAMGEAIEAEMEQMGDDWEQWGEEFERQFKDSWGNGNAVIVIPDPPDAPDAPDPPDFDDDFVVIVPTPPTRAVPPTPPMPASGGMPGGIDIDLGDLDISIDIGDLDLAVDQIDALGDIFDTQQALIEPAAEALEDLADDLREALENPDATEAEVGKLVDALSAQEAVIRKAQIVAWVKSRKLLDEDQRDKVVKAKVKRKKRHP